MRRHLSWIIPLVLLPVPYLCWLFAYSRLGDPGFDSPDNFIWDLLIAVGSPIIAVLLTATGFFFLIRGLHRTWRRWRRGKGKYTKKERYALAVQQQSNDAWAAACQLHKDAQNGTSPQPIQVWGLIARRDEAFAYDVTARYERFYGTTAEYMHSSGFILGRPAFVLAGLAANAIGNASRRNAAAARAAQQWREQQVTRILVSNQRLAVHANGQWISFDFAAVSALYPSPETWSVTFEFPSTSPLRLVGDGAPLIAVWSVLATQGREAVAQHPGLAPLRSMSTEVASEE